MSSSPSSLSSSPEPAPSDGGDTMDLTIHHHGSTHIFTLPSDGTLADLNAAITSSLGIEAGQQKLMISPKIGLLRPPYKDPSLALSSLADKKVQLLAPLQSELSRLASASAAASRPRFSSNPAFRTRAPARTQTHSRAYADANYTFGTITVLPYLPHPDRSRRFLERLAADRGVRTAMRLHGFRVGVLTEMDPAAHTTHESRTLGLNRNAGEVIELRLRTDAYDGYRDYRTVRKTLCHELAHNVHGEHDQAFWKLTRLIERQVEQADWDTSGKTLAEDEFYNPADRDREVGDHVDGGGWTGGEYVLGVSQTAGSPGTTSSNHAPVGLSRRELMAKAAEERMKRTAEGKEAEK